MLQLINFDFFTVKETVNTQTFNKSVALNDKQN